MTCKDVISPVRLGLIPSLFHDFNFQQIFDIFTFYFTDKHKVVSSQLKV